MQQQSADWPAGSEQRSSPRKVLKARAVLTVKGAPPLAVRTIDISGQGVCLAFLQALPVGLTGSLAVDLLIEGKPHTITAQARAAYCIFSGGVYKVGFQFLSLSLTDVTLLARFLR
jgi:hypothetical protein